MTETEKVSMGKPVSIPEAYWNGEPCEARIKADDGSAVFNPWFKQLSGEQRDALKEIGPRLSLRNSQSQACRNGR